MQNIFLRSMRDSVSNVRIYGKFDILHQSVMSAKILSPSNNAKKQKTVNLFLKEKIEQVIGALPTNWYQ